MPIKIRQRRPDQLTARQRGDKLQKDSAYEIAAQNLSATYYQKKRTPGGTEQETATYTTAKAKLWDDYLAWAMANGLYEEITPQEQLMEAENGLNAQLQAVNRLRSELGLALRQVTDKIAATEE